MLRSTRILLLCTTACGQLAASSLAGKHRKAAALQVLHVMQMPQRH